MIEANWLVFLGALILGILVAWWLFAHGSKGPQQRERRPDVLDEGAAPAKRNQALIDEPPAAQFMSSPHIDPPAMAGTMAGMGEIIAVAAQDEIDHVVPKTEAMPEKTGKVPAAPAALAAGEGDDLRKLKGVGPKLVALLQSLGVTSFAQIAAWSEADIDAMDAKMGSFAGRIRRDNWVEQAKLLATGDKAAYEARFGKL